MEKKKEYPREYEDLVQQDWVGVASKGIAGMTPADKGWILAFVIIFGMFQISNYLLSIAREESESERTARLVSYFNKIEDSRVDLEKNRSEEVRRLQETVKYLVQTIAREAERKGREELEKQ